MDSGISALGCLGVPSCTPRAQSADLALRLQGFSCFFFFWGGGAGRGGGGGFLGGRGGGWQVVSRTRRSVGGTTCAGFVGIQLEGGSAFGAYRFWVEPGNLWASVHVHEITKL